MAGSHQVGVFSGNGPHGQEALSSSQNGMLPSIGGSGHETLLSQYKKCTEANNEQLRNARNLEEIVKIKVQAIDGRLGNQAGVESNDPNYDFKFDPIHFR